LVPVRLHVLHVKYNSKRRQCVGICVSTNLQSVSSILTDAQTAKTTKRYAPYRASLVTYDTSPTLPVKNPLVQSRAVRLNRPWKSRKPNVSCTGSMIHSAPKPIRPSSCTCGESSSRWRERPLLLKMPVKRQSGAILAISRELVSGFSGKTRFPRTLAP
jgi:hypothetical protein